MRLSDKIDIIDSALVLRQWKNTKDPFVIADAMKIEIIYCDVNLSVMEGYSYYSKTKMEIKINSNIRKQKQISVCAHELGHIIFKHTGKSYYKEINLKEGEKEYCANLFAVAFLYLYNRYKYKSDIIYLSNYSLQTILDGKG